MNISSTIESLQDIMCKDDGIDGDLQNYQTFWQQVDSLVETLGGLFEIGSPK